MSAEPGVEEVAEPTAEGAPPLQGAAPGEVVIFYDEDCGFCRWSLGLLLKWDRDRRLRPAPIQSDEGQRSLEPVPDDLLMESAHARLPDSRVFSGGLAFEHVAPLLPAAAPLAALARKFPRAADRGYRAVSASRSTIGPRLPDAWIAWGDRVIASRR